MSKKKRGTFIHGIGASEHLDSSGERIKIEGVDISSLTKDGVFNWEHDSKNPASIVGKILEAKKFYKKSDCENEHHLYFWEKVKMPFLYVAGELFDAVEHKEAENIAAMLRYDEQNEEETKKLINFSIEGSRLEKRGSDINKCIARKITITIVPCNKVCEAGLKPNPESENKKEFNFINSLVVEKGEKLSSCQIMKSLPTPWDSKIKNAYQSGKEPNKLTTGDRITYPKKKSPTDIYGKMPPKEPNWKKAEEDIAAPPKDNKKAQIKVGTKIESEHNKTIKRIIKDAKANKLKSLKYYQKGIAEEHVEEIKDYYTRLINMENKAKKIKKSQRSVEEIDIDLKKLKKGRPSKTKRQASQREIQAPDGYKKVSKQPTMGYKDAYTDPQRESTARKRKKTPRKKSILPKRNKRKNIYASNFRKALTASAGLGGSSPATRSQGNALQSFTKSEKKQILVQLANESFERFQKKEELVNFITNKLPNRSPKEVLAIAKTVAYAHLKKKEMLLNKLIKKEDDDLLAPQEPVKKKDPKILTVGGKKLKPNDTIKTQLSCIFDTQRGELRTPMGNFKAKFPSKKDEEYQAILETPEIKEFHQNAMNNWFLVQNLAKNKKIPKQLVAHASLFSMLSSNMPVPAQEMFYGRLVDASEELGIEPGTPEWVEAFKEGGEGIKKLKQLDSPHEMPRFSNEYYEQNPQMRQKSNTKTRKKGEVKALVGLNQFTKKIALYSPDVLSYLDKMLKQYGANTQDIVSKMMADKTNKDIQTPHPMKQGIGLASKTSRFAMSMLGGSNSVVPDTHFIRHMFGLDVAKDAKAISYLKQILWMPENHKLLNTIDDYFYKKNPAIQYVENNYRDKFENKKTKNSIFPAFWLYWLTIPEHERQLGKGKPEQATNLTSHTPYFDMAKKILTKYSLVDASGSIITTKLSDKMKKSDQIEDILTNGLGDNDLHNRIAAAMAEIEEECGSAFASMMFYSVFVPILIENEDETADVEEYEKITKADIYDFKTGNKIISHDELNDDDENPF